MGPAGRARLCSSPALRARPRAAREGSAIAVSRLALPGFRHLLGGVAAVLVPRRVLRADAGEPNAVHVALVRERLPRAEVAVAAVHWMGVDALHRVVVQEPEELAASLVELGEDRVLCWSGQRSEVTPRSGVEAGEAPSVHLAQAPNLATPSDPLHSRQPLEPSEARADRAAGVGPGQTGEE